MGDQSASTHIQVELLTVTLGNSILLEFRFTHHKVLAGSSFHEEIHRGLGEYCSSIMYSQELKFIVLSVQCLMKCSWSFLCM